ncbi:hypothetical protein HMPREF9946_04010 [Acetobacteraceae bacterium AT-5844]|nr:hypothetical protein HMPREF9946_04010 [Acetobacteraceae bacterium AT-5844]
MLPMNGKAPGGLLPSERTTPQRSDFTAIFWGIWASRMMGWKRTRP